MKGMVFVWLCYIRRLHKILHKLRFETSIRFSRGLPLQALETLASKKFDPYVLLVLEFLYASAKSSPSTLPRHALNFCFLSIHFQYPKVAAVEGAASAKKIQSWDEATVNPPAEFVPKNCIPNSVYERQSS